MPLVLCGLGKMRMAKSKTIVEMNVAERETLLARAAESGMAPDDVSRIRDVFESYAYISNLIEHKNLSLARLRPMLFGARTESSANVLGAAAVALDGAPSPPAPAASKPLAAADAAPASPARSTSHRPTLLDLQKSRSSR